MGWEYEESRDWEDVKSKIALLQLVRLVQQYIEGNRKGIDTWLPDGSAVAMNFQGRPDAFITISPLSDKVTGTVDTGRVVRVYLKSNDGILNRHLATLFYGPPPGRWSFRRKRRQRKPTFYV